MNSKRFYPERFKQGDEPEPFAGESLIPGTILSSPLGSKEKEYGFVSLAAGREGVE